MHLPTTHGKTHQKTSTATAWRFPGISPAFTAMTGVGILPDGKIKDPNPANHQTGALNKQIDALKSFPDPGYKLPDRVSRFPSPVINGTRTPKRLRNASTCFPDPTNSVTDTPKKIPDPAYKMPGQGLSHEIKNLTPNGRISPLTPPMSWECGSPVPTDSHPMARAQSTRKHPGSVDVNPFSTRFHP